MDKPLVSVIVTTRNNHSTLDACLRSINEQTYAPLELIVVDNNSSDDTKEIARKYTDRVYNRGPERSAQRNFGVATADGEYVAIIDSDMELDSQVITACVTAIKNQADAQGVIIPEESFGQGFWAECKKLERSFYVGIDWMEAARFFTRQTFMSVGGYDEKMVSGEDWDLSSRVASSGELLRVKPFIYHNEGNLKLWKTLKKKVYYASQAHVYLAKNDVGSKLTTKAGPLQRYRLFFAQPGKLFKDPLLAIGMLFMKTCEFAFGAVGYVFSSRRAIHE